MQYQLQELQVVLKIIVALVVAEGVVAIAPELAVAVVVVVAAIAVAVAVA